MAKRKTKPVAPAPVAPAPVAPAPVAPAPVTAWQALLARTPLATVVAYAPAPAPMVGAPAPAPVAPAPVAPVAAAIPARGQATLARWGKGKVTGQTTLTPSALRFLASTPTTQIACNVAAQPKLPQSTPAARFLASYAYKGTVAKGNKTTIEALVNLYNAKGWGEKLMYADLAWDVNHGFVLVNGVNGVTL